MNKNKWGFASL